MRKIILFIISFLFLSANEELSVITVDSKKEQSSTDVSSSIINRTKIENSVVGNGFISSLLDTNAEMDVTDKSKHSQTAGEIAPGKISINKAPFYQNNFLIDGVSNNSLLDPNLSNANDPYDVPGNENETFLDLDLVELIHVYTTNISAEYGSFTGGVIAAKTIRPKPKFSMKLSWSHTSDKFLKVHVANKEEFEKAKNDYNQPKFEKNFYNAYVNMPIGEETGLVVSYSLKKSVIPGAYFYGFKDKKRQNQSFFIKTSHFLDNDAVLDLSASYSPYESTHFQEFIKDSFTTIKGGGYSLKASYGKDFSRWSLDNNFAFRRSQNTKDSLNYNKRWIKTVNKPWGPHKEKGQEYSQEGGSGRIEKTQTGLSYNIKARTNSFKIAGFSYDVKSGLGIDYNKGEYNRKENTYYYVEPNEFGEKLNCLYDDEGCVESEQYFMQRRVYQKEKASASITATNYYLESKLQYGRFELTPGLRLDYNDYLKNFDPAYRINSSIRPFANNKTMIYGGFNRYYGKSFLGYKLREARLPYYEEYRSTNKGDLKPWGTSADKDSDKYVFSGLKTPYSDERSVGIRQDIDLIKLRLNLKYAHRKDKDKFSRHKGDYKVYTLPSGTLKGYYRPTFFGNEGYGRSETTSLNVGPTSPIDLGIAHMGYSFSTSWTSSSANSDDYDSLISDEPNNNVNVVWYDGNFIDRNDIPIASDPKNYNFHLNFAFVPFNFFGSVCKANLNSIIRIKSAYSDIQPSIDSDNTRTYKETLPDGSTKTYDVTVYEKIHFKQSEVVDLRANFNFRLYDKHTIMLSTEISNLFDNVVNLGTSRTRFATGRQFWFTLSYKY